MPRAGVPSASDWMAVTRRSLLLVMGLEFLVHQRFHLVDVVGAQRHHAQVVAEEFDGVVVVGECREALEDRRAFGVFDMRLEGQQALGLHQLEQAELQAEQLDIGRLVVARALATACRTRRSVCFSTGPVLPMM